MHHDDYGDHMLLRTPKGDKRIYYKGGGKADSHKSFTGMSFGSVFFCEINLLHMNAIQEAFRRTMAAKKRWHIADLNPPAPNHPIISEVFEVQDTRWTHWTPQDNPALTEERKQELFETLSKNRYLLQRDWYGMRVIPEGVIYSMFDTTKHILQSIPKDAPIAEMFLSLIHIYPLVSLRSSQQHVVSVVIMVHGPESGKNGHQPQTITVHNQFERLLLIVGQD